MSQQQTLYRHRLTTEVFDVFEVFVVALILLKTCVVLSQHLPTPGWIIKDHLILVALVGYLIFSVFKSHDVRVHLHCTYVLSLPNHR